MPSLISRTRIAWLCCVLLVYAVPASAELKLASLFRDHLVLQQGQPLPVWGKAAAGERITVTMGDHAATATADAVGQWRATLPAMPVKATPQTLTVTGASEKVTITDVLIGEVWLCSGQSNMAWVVGNSNNAAAEIANANYPNIRMFHVTGAAPGYSKAALRAYSSTPQDECLGEWQPCTPKHAARFSAAAYFFGREIHLRQGVPVGLIDASFGATAIEAWMSLEALKAVPRYRERALSYERSVAAKVAAPDAYPAAVQALVPAFEQRRQVWFEALDAEDPGMKDKWMSPDLAIGDWDRMALPVSLADNPIGAPVAAIWFCRDLEIPAAWVGQELTLDLGVIDGGDECYINGQRVGRTWFDTDRYWEVKRHYTVPATAIHDGHVRIALRVLKLVYQMAIFGPADEMRLLPAKTPEAPPVGLAGEWRWRKSQDLDPGREPQPPFRDLPGSNYGHPAVMYNALIHPLAPYAIRGAIWYQGEANVPFYVDYRDLLPGLISSWRQEWGQGDFPFGIVQLANYQGQQTHPVERVGYHNLRDAQAAARRVPGAFLATAMDIGEGGNIHPRNKQELGRRLALGALAGVYGHADLVATGPSCKSMTIEGSVIRLQFDSAVGLRSQGEPLVGFVIAGEDRAFYFAKAEIDGETVKVWSEKVPRPVAVRYAWASNPVCNLYNAANLPAFPFRTEAWDPAKLVITDDPMVLPSGWRPK
jgi:sialate O-acetylesterase